MIGYLQIVWRVKVAVWAQFNVACGCWEASISTTSADVLKMRALMLFVVCKSGQDVIIQKRSRGRWMILLLLFLFGWCAASKLAAFFQSSAATAGCCWLPCCTLAVSLRPPVRCESFCIDGLGMDWNCILPSDHVEVTRSLSLICHSYQAGVRQGHSASG